LDCEVGESRGGGEEQCFDVIQIDCRHDLGDIANLGDRANQLQAHLSAQTTYRWRLTCWRKTLEPRSAAAVAARDDFELVAIRICEIETPATVIAVNLVWSRSSGIRPISQSLRTDASEHGVKIAFSNEKRVMLQRDIAFFLHEIE
jgi:hypothetical protein